MNSTNTFVKTYAIVCLYTIAILVLGFIIGAKAFKADSPTDSAPAQTSVATTLSEWETTQLALILTESQMDSLAVGKANDLGILQITPIFVDEVNRLVGKDIFIHQDALSPEKSLQMLAIYQSHKNPTHDTDKAIQLHNPKGGYAYARKVKKNIERVKTYEYYRTLVTNSSH